MKTLLKGSLALAAALFGFTAVSQAQTVVFNGIGSSALFLELGEATSASTSGLSPLPECIYTTKKSASTLFATDPTVGLTEAGQAWIAWTPGTASTKGAKPSCQTISASTQIYSYLQTDSVVGDRCVFNGCVITNNLSTTTPSAQLVWTKALNTGTTVVVGEEVQYLPAAIVAAFTGSNAVTNVAGTDIRPEDAAFATKRALTPCGEAITQYTGGNGSATQYLGLGYSSGSKIASYYSGSTFNVVPFTLPSRFYVTPLGADPIMVAVNSTDATNTGFNSTAVTNLNRSVLALYLDGSISSTADAIPSGGPTGYTAAPTNVIVREPLSGTYNTMEYNIPNTVSLQTSQDVGLNQPASTQNCTSLGGGPLWNSQNVPMATLASGIRTRAIGTGEELSKLFANNDALGYGFWTTANFQAAPATAKYLTIDGVDPIQTTYGTGVIPTPTNGKLSLVKFTHILDGTYPIWSLVRLVTTSTQQQTIANQLALVVAKYANTTASPDFVPYYTTTGTVNLHIERAHFTPPGIYTESTAPVPVDGDGVPANEVGGDVGGVVIPVSVDTDYLLDTGATYTGTVVGSNGVPTSYHRD